MLPLPWLLQHLVLGFELHLYAPEGFCMMAWCDPSLSFQYNSYLPISNPAAAPNDSLAAALCGCCSASCTMF